MTSVCAHTSFHANDLVCLTTSSVKGVAREDASFRRGCSAMSKHRRVEWSLFLIAVSITSHISLRYEVSRTVSGSCLVSCIV